MKFLSPTTTSTVLLAAVASSSFSSSDAFPVSPRISTTALRVTDLRMTYSEYNSRSSSSQGTDPNYVFPSLQAGAEISGNPPRIRGEKRRALQRAFTDAATTFAAYRELEAAGLLNEQDTVIDKEAAKRKAAEKFATFAKQAQRDLEAVNNNTPSTVKVPDALEHVLINTAAALGRTTGQIFGGNEPENYRD